MTSRSALVPRVAALLLVALSTLVPTACQSSRCGDGTVERDGVCVPATDGPVCNECGSSPACHNGLASDGSCECDDGYVPADPDNPSNLACVLAGGQNGDDGDDDSGGSVTFVTTNDSDADSSDGEGGGDPYGACPSGSDAECPIEVRCEATIGSCAGDCLEDQHCPDPIEGTAVQICVSIGEFEIYSCVLSCAADGASCPADMTCDENTDSQSYLLCVRP